MSGVQAAVAPPRAPFTLLASCLSMLALGVNGTAIMAALPTVRHDLGLNPAQVEWAINAYLVVSAACIIPGGKACDWLGARLVSVVGLALFAFASVIVATGQVPAAILAGRALQGLAAALAVPGTLAVVSEVQFARTPCLSDQRLGGLRDARLQPRSADRRNTDPLPRLARHLLGERWQHACRRHRICGHGAGCDGA